MRSFEIKVIELRIVIKKRYIVYRRRQTHVDRSKDIVNEAALITQLGIDEETLGIRDIVRQLRSRVALFMGRMEETRRKISDTLACYEILDKVCGFLSKADE